MVIHTLGIGEVRVLNEDRVNNGDEVSGVDPTR